MSRAITLCPFCTIRALPRISQNTNTIQWQQSRMFTRVQRRKPARMELSARVAQPRGDRTSAPAERWARDGEDRASRPVHDRRGKLSAASNRDIRRAPQGSFSTHRDRSSDRASRSSPGSKSRDKSFAPDAPPRRSTVPAPERPRFTGGAFGGLNRTKAPEGLERPRRRREARDTLENAPQRRSSTQLDGTRRRRTEPFHALKMQAALGSVTYSKRGDIKAQIEGIESFKAFPLLPIIQDAIQPQVFPGMTEVEPTPVQRVTIPTLLSPVMNKGKRKSARDAFGEKETPEEFLIAAETGSGKTLAYLLPVVDAMKRAELVERELEEREAQVKIEEKRQWKANSMFELEAPTLTTEENNAARPKVVILVPSAELVTQIGAVAKSLSHIVKFKTAMISTAFTPTVIRNRLFSPSGVDIVISTPHLLSSIAEDSPNVLARVTHLVVDEADSMFDRSFASLTSAIIDKATPSLKQLILCSATITRSLDTYITRRFPNMQRLVTPNLHAIPRRIQMGVVNVNLDPYRGKKDLACADTIWGIGRSAMEHDSHDTERVDIKRILVFVNERETAVELAGFLQEKGIDAEALNRDTPGRQTEVLAPFKASSREAASMPASEYEPGPNYVPATSNIKRRLANTKVLVCTDLGSRGIDTLACRHVILYDVPHTSIDFIHRLGRLGRMGRRGRAMVLLGKGDRADVVKEVRDAMYTGKALI